jgi:hypothetical protein
MKRLLNFESFVPKNTDKRSKDKEKIYETFVKEFSINLEKIKTKTSNDPIEQLFIDLIKDCQIKLDQQKNPFRMYLFYDDKYMFDYNFEKEFFWCHYDRVWSVFNSKFKIQYEAFEEFISDMVEKYFNFRPYSSFIALKHYNPHIPNF